MELRVNFAKYKVERVLGEGAMGVVYSAFDPGIGRRVAVKTIHASLLRGSSGEELKQRFKREIKAVGKLSHPNIVSIYDSDEIVDDSGIMIPYFVMEYVDGEELQDILSDGARLPFSKSMDIAFQILDAFSYTHKFDIVHRDIKPANIFISRNGQVKIADFGIARMEDSSLTQTGVVAGTPNYMSPEQCAGQNLDTRSDLFSIAIVIYEMLTGEKPFAANSVHATMMKIAQTIPEPITSMNPTLPAGLNVVMAKALAKNPNARYKNAGEFSAALKLACPSGMTAENGLTALSDTDATINIRVVANAKLKRKLLASGAGLAGLALTMTVGFYWLNISSIDSNTAVTVTDSVVYESTPPDSQGQNSNPAASDVALEVQQKVQRILGVAAAHEAAGRLIYPPTSSAYYAYHIVLDELDPGNPLAVRGLKNIETLLEDQAQVYYQNREFEVLEAHLDTSLQVFPENKVLSAMKNSLSQSSFSSRM